MEMPTINPKAQQIDAEVISNKRLGSYNHLVLAVNELAGYARPGNFVAISVGGPGSAMVLRRAFAIYRAHIRPDGQGIMELVVAPHGNGSKWLAARAPGEKVNIVAPLGTAFGIPTEPVRALLVGGGYGSAPLFALAETLKAKGCRVDMVLGASTATKIYAPLEGKRSVNSMTITTDDGSAGTLGRVSDVLPAIIEQNAIEIIYSCGPMAMLAAITEIANYFGVLHQCSVEESMACGIGVCMTCVLPVEGSDGITRMVRSCIEGPVMDGSKVTWSKSREVPDGVWGKK
jgi:dihydroorotate dehydrogenase electron transfer subunit